MTTSVDATPVGTGIAPGAVPLPTAGPVPVRSDVDAPGGAAAVDQDDEHLITAGSRVHPELRVVLQQRCEDAVPQDGQVAPEADQGPIVREDGIRCSHL